MRLYQLTNNRWIAQLDNGFAAGAWTKEEAVQKLSDQMHDVQNELRATLCMWEKCDEEFNHFVENEPDN